MIATVAVSTAFLVCTGFAADGDKDVYSAPFGFVLSGGGANGAYEVGVWQALQELDVASNITAIAGTSVGALNAALFAACPGDAEKLWMENVTGVFKVKTDCVIADASKTVGDVLAARTADGESVVNGKKWWTALSARIGGGFQVRLSSPSPLGPDGRLSAVWSAVLTSGCCWIIIGLVLIFWLSFHTL